ncbi:nmrA-like family domain-containing protein 1 [Littorina saxatilis]|uniref:NmrA-like family domain-containing protein 1 n=1 Tax=Littorina saxatilis TaxID=31220 RepID=A0AAN9G2Q1_9CAEN
MAETDSSSASASEETSARPGLRSSVTSAEIELRQSTSADLGKKTASKLTEIKITEVTPIEKEPSPTTSTSKPSTSSSETESATKTATGRTSAKSSVTFAPEPAKLEKTSAFATTSLSLDSSSSSKKKEDQRRWTAVEEADARKGFMISMKRVMGCGSSLDAMYDDPMPVVVFGATGLVGGAVARALLRDKRFEVKAVTRSPTTDVSRKLAEEGAIIVTADLNDPRSVNRAVGGAHAVFLVTHYWEHMDKDKEIQQGKHCVDAAVSAGVAHFVFYGSESPKNVCDVECGYMDAKAEIENYVKDTILPYTALRLPFYFEHLLSVFRPHKVRPGVFAVALPMEDKPMDCISVKDVGRCVVNVLLRPKAHLCRVLPVTAEKLTVQQITDTLNKHFADRKFICPRIRVKDYEGFGFKGSKDIAGMFQFFQDGQEVHDVKVTRRVNSSLCSFDRWVVENKQKLAEAMNVPE